MNTIFLGKPKNHNYSTKLHYTSEEVLVKITKNSSGKTFSQFFGFFVKAIVRVVISNLHCMNV